MKENESTDILDLFITGTDVAEIGGCMRAEPLDWETGVGNGGVLIFKKVPRMCVAITG